MLCSQDQRERVTAACVFTLSEVAVQRLHVDHSARRALRVCPSCLKAAI